MTPADVAAWANVPMDTPIITLAARLVCSKCGLPAGDFRGHNPGVGFARAGGRRRATTIRNFLSASLLKATGGASHADT